MNAGGEYATAVGIGLLLLLMRRNLSWAALATVALDEAIEGLVLLFVVFVGRARRLVRAPFVRDR